MTLGTSGQAPPLPRAQDAELPATSDGVSPEVSPWLALVQLHADKQQRQPKNKLHQQLLLTEQLSGKAFLERGDLTH